MSSSDVIICHDWHTAAEMPCSADDVFRRRMIRVARYSLSFSPPFATWVFTGLFTQDVLDARGIRRVFFHLDGIEFFRR